MESLRAADLTIAIVAITFDSTRVKLAGGLISDKAADCLRGVFLSLLDLFRLRKIEVDVTGLGAIDKGGLSVLGEMYFAATIRGTRVDVINENPLIPETIVSACRRIQEGLQFSQGQSGKARG